MLTHSKRDSRISTLCIFLCFSLSISFRRNSSSILLPSLTKNPPLELTIFERSYSKYVPSLESRLRGFEEDATGCVGEPCPAGVTVIDRLLFAFKNEEDEADCSLLRWAALAVRDVIKSMFSDANRRLHTFQPVNLDLFDVFWRCLQSTRIKTPWRRRARSCYSLRHVLRSRQFVVEVAI